MKIGLVGATGVVGEQILEQFVACSFPLGELRLFASDASVGEIIDVAGESLTVLSLDPTCFDGLDMVLFATPDTVSREWVPQVEAKGILCIDLSSQGRLSADRELVAVGVNDEELKTVRLSTPASLSFQLALLLSAFQPVGELRSVLVTAVSPATAAGRAGFVELQKQAGELLNGRPAVSHVFSGQLAFNCLPGIAGEEQQRVTDELRKILASPGLDVRLNRLQVPTFYGEGAFVRLEFAEPVEVDALRQQVEAHASLDLRETPSPMEAVGEDSVLVHLAEAGAPSRFMDLWYVADNAGFSSAGNLVRLVERIADRFRQVEG